jgi:hypothetical protein
MCIGADEGCHDVPDATVPIDITFFSLDPTRTPMSSFAITSSGPMFIEPVRIPGIWPIGLAEGLADGMGMFICVDGDCEGEAAGICPPGIFISGVGFGGAVDGDFGDGIGEDFGAGIFIPGICCDLVCAAHTTSIRLKAETKPTVRNISEDRRMTIPLDFNYTRDLRLGAVRTGTAPFK